MDSEFETISEQARFLRQTLEHILLDALGTTETAGSCLQAAILLSTTLGNFAGASCLVCGGGPPVDGGLLDKGGTLRGHYWVEGQTASGKRFVADITADQFGFDKVVLLAEDEARARYFPGDPALIAQHVLEERTSWSADVALSP